MPCFPPPPFSPYPSYALVEHAAWSDFPLHPLSFYGRRELPCGRSPPPLLHLLTTRWRSARPGQGFPLHPLALYRRCALPFGGSPAPPPSPDYKLEERAAWSGFPPLYLGCVQESRAAGWGGPPLSSIS